ncbi:MAG: DUF3800 domain-containing protein [Hyphomicrobiaceae bacterium]
MTRHSYNIYCDETCHLENDGIPVMVLGGLYCRREDTRCIADAIREIKARHALPKGFEIKWTKVSRGKLGFYRDLIAFFLSENALRFRGVLVPDKQLLDHGRFGQDHNDWYYKMYYTMLRYVFDQQHQYHVYLDIKDTRGGEKTRHLHDVLCNSLHDFDRETVVKVQQIRSEESEVLQLADLLIGAIGYHNRNLSSSDAKQTLIADMRERLGQNALASTSGFRQRKFNLLRWQANGTGE